MSWLSKLCRQYGPNPFQSLLKKAAKEGKKTILLCWNRGLGDIPLGIVPTIQEIRSHIPEAQITIVTRKDLAEGFSLIEGIQVIVDPNWVRKQEYQIDPALVRVEEFDLVLLHPDPTRWFYGKKNKVPPQLCWKEKWDKQGSGLLGKEKEIYLAAHIETQTEYGYEKNWPLAYWQKLFTLLPKEWGVVLIGGSSNTSFVGENIVDLRGKTSLIELLALIKTRCRYLIGPDSGILSLVYYLHGSYPLQMISLWADPKQGILKEGSPSPNPLLQHSPCIASDQDLKRLLPEEVRERILI